MVTASSPSARRPAKHGYVRGWALDIAGGTAVSSEPVVVVVAGNFQYEGPSFTASSTAWWYGQGIYTLSLG